MQVSLAELKPGTSGEIVTLSLPNKKKGRLQALGLLPGEQVKCICVASSRSPMAFFVKGALVALRTCDCRNIVVAQLE